MMRTCFVALFLFFGAIGCATADSSQQRASDFVLDLFQGFQEIYAPEAPDSEQALSDYYQRHFDHALIARFVFGGYGRRATAAQLSRFQDLLPRFLLAQVGPQIQEYLGADSDNRVAILGVRSLKKQHLMVQAVYTGAKKVEIDIRLRPLDGTLKVVDVQVAGISMLLAQRDLIASMIKQNNGDLELFFEQLAQKAHA